MDRMRVMLIGANGNVGRELCFLFKDDPEINLVPVVRNTFGASLLERYGIECSINDIGNPEDARKIAENADAVVIAAFVQSGARRETEINKRIAENSIKYLRPGATAIYISTIRVFGRSVDPRVPILAMPSRYELRKKQGEALLEKLSRKTKTKGFVLRLGHVYGAMQPRTQDLAELLSRLDTVRIAVDGDRPSNVIHTVSIKDAIKACIKRGVAPGTYSLVNSPQWTWREIFEYYSNGKTKLIFEGKKRAPRKSLASRLLGPLQQLVISQRMRWDGMRAYFPDRVEEWIKKQHSVKGFRQMPTENDLPFLIATGDLQYHPMPGKTIDELKETKSLLQEYEAIPKSLYVREEISTNHKGSPVNP